MNGFSRLSVWSFIWTGLVATIGIGDVHPANGQHATIPYDRLLPTSPETDRLYGHALAFDGDQLLVGSRYSFVSLDNTLRQAGLVDLIDLKTMTTVYRIEAPEVGNNMYWKERAFGQSVAFYGDQIIIGEAHPGSGDHGAVYWYNRRTGTMEHAIYSRALSLAGYPGIRELGASIAVDDDTAVFGVTGAYSNSSIWRNGAALLYDVVNQQAGEIIHNPNPIGSGDWFGYDIALNGDRLLIGSPNDDRYVWPTRYKNAGSVGIYNLSDTTLDDMQLADEQISEGAQFGFQVEWYGDVAVVGARGESAIYVSDPDPAVAYRKLEIDGVSPQPGDWFGHAIAIEGDLMIVGAPGADNRRGEVYIIDLSTERLVMKLQPSHLQPLDEFGGSVAISGRKIAVGAIGEDTAVENGGAVYLYNVPEPGTLTLLLLIAVVLAYRRGRPIRIQAARRVDKTCGG